MSFWRSSGSNFSESCVEPTRSQNITVIWRNSASRCCPLLGDTSVTFETAVVVPVRWPAAVNASMALSNFLRWPNETPSFSRSSSVKSGRTEYSILFSANVWTYWPRPCLPSHSAKSVVGLAIAETLTYDRVSLEGSRARDPLCGRLVAL